MSLDLRECSGAKVISPRGDLTLSVACEIDSLAQSLSRANQGRLRLIVNLRNVSSMTMEGAEQLCQVYRFGQMRFCEAPARVRAFVSITEYLWVFDLCSTQDEALASLAN